MPNNPLPRRSFATEALCPKAPQTTRVLQARTIGRQMIEYPTEHGLRKEGSNNPTPEYCQAVKGAREDEVIASFIHFTAKIAPVRQCFVACIVIRGVNLSREQKRSFVDQRLRIADAKVTRQEILRVGWLFRVSVTHTHRSMRRSGACGAISLSFTTSLAEYAPLTPSRNCSARLSTLQPARGRKDRHKFVRPLRQESYDYFSAGRGV